MPSCDNMYYLESLLPFNDYGAFVGEELPRIMRAIYLARGTEDGFLESTRAFRDQLVGDGVDVTYDEQPRGHECDFWDAQIKKVIDWLPLDDAGQGFGSGAID